MSQTTRTEAQKAFQWWRGKRRAKAYNRNRGDYDYQSPPTIEETWEGAWEAALLAVEEAIVHKRTEVGEGWIEEASAYADAIEIARSLRR
jgi:hypothetical protein